MPQGRSMVLVALAFALVPGPGCSWIFVNKPPPEPVPMTPPVICTSSVASPVVDTVLAAIALGVGVAGIVAGSQPEPACPSNDWCFTGLMSGVKTGSGVAGGILVASAIPLAFSAAHGYATTADCRELTETQLACVSGVEASCKRLTNAPDAPANVGAPCSVPDDCKGGTTCAPGSGSTGRCVGR